MDIDNNIQTIRKEFYQDLEQNMDPQDLKVKYLGRKGYVSQLFKSLKDVNEEDRAQVGQDINAFKEEIFSELPEQKHEEKDFPNIVPPSNVGKDMGHMSPVSQAIFEIQDILAPLGFSVITGSERETEHYNFDVLNIPPEHPARDMWDTIWVSNPEQQTSLLRTHTSPAQIHYMEEHKPPLRLLSPGKVYRYEATDATHETVFHQVEGLMVDSSTSIATFKGIMKELFSNLFDETVDIRLRPSYFPFTEPSFELDVKYNDTWLELAGAGMVHRKVLQAGGITDNSYQGFAFGLGIERLIMIRSRIDDIRLIHSGDLRFIHQLGRQKINTRS